LDDIPLCYTCRILVFKYIPTSVLGNQQAVIRVLYLQNVQLLTVGGKEALPESPVAFHHPCVSKNCEVYSDFE